MTVTNPADNIERVVFLVFILIRTVEHGWHLKTAKTDIQLFFIIHQNNFELTISISSPEF